MLTVPPWLKMKAETEGLHATALGQGQTAGSKNSLKLALSRDALLHLQQTHDREHPTGRIRIT